MSVLIFAENQNGKFPKSALEAVSYGAEVAAMMGTEAIAITCGSISGDGGLGSAGAAKVWIANASTSDSQLMGKLMVAAASPAGANVIIFSHDVAGKMIAPRVAARLDAGLVPGATALPSADFVVRKNVFSGKAIADVAIHTANKVITVLPNSLGVKNTGTAASVDTFAFDAGASRIAVKEVKSENKDGEIYTELNAVRALIQADRIHLTNIIFNLIDNALKYSKEKPVIKIMTSSDENDMVIEII